MTLFTPYQREIMQDRLKKGFTIDVNGTNVVLLNTKTKTVIPIYSASLYCNPWPETRSDRRPEDEVRTQMKNLAEMVRKELQS